MNDTLFIVIIHIVSLLIASLLTFLGLYNVSKKKFIISVSKYNWWLMFLVLVASNYILCAMLLMLPFDIVMDKINLNLRQHLDTFWYTSNIIVVILTWLVLPITKSVIESGHFTFGKKILYSLKSHFKFYIITSLIGLFFIILIISIDHISFANIGDALIVTSNTIGLTLYVIYIGYGFVNITKELWKLIKHDTRITFLQNKLSRYQMKHIDADMEIEEIADKISMIPREYLYNQKIAEYHNIIISKCPISNINSEFSHNMVKENDITISWLENLHTNLNKNLIKSHHYRHICCDIKNKIDYYSKLSKTSSCHYWHFIPSVYFILTILSVSFSIIFVWSNTLYLINSVDLDVFSNISRILGNVSVWFEIAFMGFVMIIMSHYVFSFRSNNTEFTKIMFKISLIEPLCLNFIHIFRSSNTSYENTIGNVKTFISSFGLYYPLVLIVVCIIAALNPFNKFLKKIGMGHIIFNDDNND